MVVVVLRRANRFPGFPKYREGISGFFVSTRVELGWLICRRLSIRTSLSRIIPSLCTPRPVGIKSLVPIPYHIALFAPIDEASSLAAFLVLHMRLLHLEGNGKFSLTEYYGKSIPPYAILSHTWGADNQEVSFKDVTEDNGSNETKLGYNKLYFCAKQAASNGLEHFWVDTCCIDKKYFTRPPNGG
jgi:hypothetical protein